MTRARVLVVDDKENFTKLFRRLLPEDRFDVTTAGDGTRALALIGASEFDVIVSDIRMPGADGLEVLRQARAHDPDVEVILMTAFASVPAGRAGFSSNAVMSPSSLSWTMPDARGAGV